MRLVLRSKRSAGGSGAAEILLWWVVLCGRPAQAPIHLNPEAHRDAEGAVEMAGVGQAQLVHLLCAHTGRNKSQKAHRLRPDEASEALRRERRAAAAAAQHSAAPLLLSICAPVCCSPQ